MMADIERRALEGLGILDSYFDDSGDAEDDISDLIDEIQSFCPPYVTFGSHPGDGADFGFWPDIDALEEGARFGEVLKVDDTAEIPADYRGLVMQVSDHGNVALYQAEGDSLAELWSCV